MGNDSIFATGGNQTTIEPVELRITEQMIGNQPCGTPTPTPTPGNVLYDQYDNFATEEPINIPSQDAEPALDFFDSQAADDFVVPAGETWQIHRSGRACGI